MRPPVPPPVGRLLSLEDRVAVVTGVSAGIGHGIAQRLLEAGAGKALDRGYLYLQAESHPVEFRRVEIQPLD